MLLSVIIPVYNEANNLAVLRERLVSTIETIGLKFELIFINDGSTDDSAAVIESFALSDIRLKLINFSRNFGHQPAITAGLEACSGDCAVIIDADLQDPPELIERLFLKWKEGYQVVYAQRTGKKGEGWIKRTTAYLFYRILKSISNIDIPLDVGDFRLIDRKVIDVFKLMPEKQRFIRGMISWIGFRQTGISYRREPRFSGTTKFPMHNMLLFASTGITSFSFLPLKLATIFGIFISLGSFLYAVYVVYLKLFTDHTISGWSSLMVAILLLSGIQLLTLGIIGEYLGTIGEEIKNRPLYVIDKRINFEKYGNNNTGQNGNSAG